MGCGTSVWENVDEEKQSFDYFYKSERPASQGVQSSLAQLSKQQQYEQPPLILYAPAFSNFVIDLSGQLPRLQIALFDSVAALESKKFSHLSELIELLPRRIVFVVDIHSQWCHLLSRYYGTQLLPVAKYEIHQFIIITPTAKSEPCFVGTATGGYFLHFLCTKIAQQQGVVFVERDVWYSIYSDSRRTELVVRCLVRLAQLQAEEEAKNITAYCPFGEDTHIQLQCYHNDLCTLWESGAYRYFLSTLNEEDYELGKQRFVGRVFDTVASALSYQPFQVRDLVPATFDSSSKHAITALPLLARIVVPVPPTSKRALATAQFIQEHNSAQLIEDVSKLPRGIGSEQQEILAIIDGTTISGEEAIAAGKWLAEFPLTHVLALLILPQQKDLIARCAAPIFASERLTVTVSDSRQAQKLQHIEDLALSIAKARCSFAEMAQHLLKLPLLNILVPSFNAISLLNLDGVTPADLTTEHSHNATISFGTLDYHVPYLHTHCLYFACSVRRVAAPMGSNGFAIHAHTAAAQLLDIIESQSKELQKIGSVSDILKQMRQEYARQQGLAEAQDPPDQHQSVGEMNDLDDN